MLAAGGGKRFGMPKAKFRYGGDRLVDLAVRTARDGGCEHVLVVLGAHVCEVPSAEVIHNPRWRSGLASSLSAGLNHLASAFRQVIWPHHRHEFWPHLVQVVRLARVVVLLVRSR